MIRSLLGATVLCSWLGLAVPAPAQNYPAVPTELTAGDRMLGDYFAAETEKLTTATLAEIHSADDWQRARARYRAQLSEMLGMPLERERTPLEPKTTRSQRQGDIIIENVVFQSSPGLYVTGNFYRPAAAQADRLPAILYVCGHSPQKEDGISFGNKTAYHHHGMWFANKGYVCLTIDTVQLGEIEGIHHGTYREGRWWWNSRGYSSAAVEAWNGIRALDYLETRAEVDAGRIGITGRSGGGAYSWWVAALDERVKVAVPVAGIASLKNHVVGGTVEGHCDCMFHVNTYRWDFPAIAALVAPRPLLIANTDKDTIFPLDGVVDVYNKTRRIYRLLGAEENIGLAIAENPHQDTQPLRTEAFHWFERHLKGRAATDEIDTTAPKSLDRRTLRALDAIPQDEIVTKVDELFVPSAAPVDLPESGAAWAAMRDRWMDGLREKVFRAWPGEGADLRLEKVAEESRDGMRLLRFELDSQVAFRLPLVIAVPDGAQTLAFVPAGAADWELLSADSFTALKFSARADGEALAVFAPRGIGPGAWTSDERERVHIRRRFMLLGQTLDGMRAWDIRRGLQALRQVEEVEGMPITIVAEPEMANQALYASLFEPPVSGLSLTMPASHLAIFLNVDRVLTLQEATAMAAERSAVSVLAAGRLDPWQSVSQLVEKLGWEHRFQIVAR